MRHTCARENVPGTLTLRTYLVGHKVSQTLHQIPISDACLLPMAVRVSNLPFHQKGHIKIGGIASYLSRTNYFPSHWHTALKRRACGTPEISNLIPAFWRRCGPNHDLPHPIILLSLFRTLEHPCSPNGLATTYQKPRSVHFHSR